MRTVGIIPCRYKSTRFPGKPLAEINGKPMLWHVYQRCLEAKALDATFIATDDDRIAAACRELGLNLIMTAATHPTGTDRVAEAAEILEGDYFVNVQGDEPLIHPESIAAVARAIKENRDPAVVATNGYHVIRSPATAIDTNVVKVVVDTRHCALAFSRLPIPYPKGGEVIHRQQLGLYAFTRVGLRLFASLAAGELELAESVEMVRFLEHGYKVRMVEVFHKSVAVDTEADLELVRGMMSGAAS